MKYFIALFFAFLTFSCTYKNKDLQENSCYSTSPQGENIYSVEHKNGILFLKIGNLDLNTRASVYSRYKIRPLSKEYIFLQSSDIGDYIITNRILNEWNTFETKNIKVGAYDVFIISSKPYGLDDPERDSDGLLVLFVNGRNLEVFKLEGKFHFKFSRIDIKENSISIETELNSYTFDISDTLSLRQNKKHVPSVVR